MNNCLLCDKDTKNKKYCSHACRVKYQTEHNSYKSEEQLRIDNLESFQEAIEDELDRRRGLTRY